MYLYMPKDTFKVPPKIGIGCFKRDFRVEILGVIACLVFSRFGIDKFVWCTELDVPPFWLSTVLPVDGPFWRQQPFIVVRPLLTTRISPLLFHHSCYVGLNFCCFFCIIFLLFITYNTFRTRFWPYSYCFTKSSNIPKRTESSSEDETSISFNRTVQSKQLFLVFDDTQNPLGVQYPIILHDMYSVIQIEHCSLFEILNHFLCHID